MGIKDSLIFDLLYQDKDDQYIGLIQKYAPDLFRTSEAGSENL